MIWVLAVCIGVSWAGCAVNHHTPFPSEEACYKALEKLRFDQDASGETRRSAVAYCYPLKAKEKGDDKG